jgi:hypothetical protein
VDATRDGATPLPGLRGRTPKNPKIPKKLTGLKAG